MHGVKRQSKAAVEARKQKEQAKLTEYLALTEKVLDKKKNKDWSPEAFELTQQVLHANPELYTVWNYRRNIMLHGVFPQSTLEQINNILASDLALTTAALKQHPKVYWIWNHRRWCLEYIPDAPEEEGEPIKWKKTVWDRELFVVEKMLDVDARNFHAWNYRRYVLASMPVPRSEISELAYTTKKIEANFSNFSAWHQRTKVFTRLWQSGQLDEKISREEEFELVRNALYTDPFDQSAWMYHRWLVGSGENATVLDREIQSIQELLDEQPDSKWCMDSLVHYKRILALRRPDEAENLRQECMMLLQSLQTLDPARTRRYQGIGEQ